MQESPGAGARGDRDLLQRLPAALVRAGFVDAYQLLGPLHNRTMALRRSLDALPGPLRGAVRLLLLSETVAPGELAPLLTGETVDALVRLELCRAGPAGVATRGLILVPLAGRLAFAPAQPPAGWLGGEQTALLARVLLPRGGACLHLGTAGGALALHLASGGARVVTVDTDPAAAAVTRLNAEMAGLGERIDVRVGDLWLAAPGEQFDCITAAPPTVPMPPELGPRSEAGEGASAVRRLLGALPRVLAHDGIAQIAGACLGDERAPHPAADFERLARDQGLLLAWTLPARLSLVAGGRGFEVVAAACARTAGVAIEIARDRLGEHLARQRADHLYLYFMTASRGREGLRRTIHYSAAGGFGFR